MTIWRPASNIRFKALGLHWRGNSLLAVEITGDNGQVIGVRPLGGTVEFGETAETAVIREFQEELGIVVETRGAPMFCENIYTHEGQLGHEVLAIYAVTFPEGAFAGENRITFHEDGGATCHAAWFPLDTLDVPHGPRLYPDGLKERLLAQR